MQEILRRSGEHMRDLAYKSLLLEKFRPKSPSEASRFSIQKSEALFGWSEISKQIRPSIRCLEIGAGSGLLSYLASDEGVHVTSLEPSTAGFSHSDKMLEVVERHSFDNLQIIRTSIEGYTGSEKFDLIWSINVFEHIDDWRDALERCHALLSPGGKCVILCPNYLVPYEPHFNLPILGGKSFTSKVFRKKIEKHESDKKAYGLWDSLNFITVTQLSRHCRRNGWDVSFDKGISLRMLERFAENDGLRERHKAVGFLVSFLHRTKLKNCSKFVPASMQPYIAFTLFKSDHH